MAIGATFSMMSVFFTGGLYVAGVLGAIALLLMKFFNISIPLFILMGELVLRSGVAERMYNVLSRWLVFIPGGLIHSNIAYCAILCRLRRFQCGYCDAHHFAYPDTGFERCRSGQGVVQNNHGYSIGGRTNQPTPGNGPVRAPWREQGH